MADMSIDEATLDSQVTGAELLPASDGGAPRAVSTGKIKDYVLAQITDDGAATDAVNTVTDKVYLLKGGVVKHVSAQTLAAAVMDYAFGLAGISTPNGNEVFPISDSGTKKTITLTQMATYLANNVLIPWGNLTEAANTDALATDDFFVMRDVSAEGDKKVKIATLSSYVCEAFKAYVTYTLTGIGTTIPTEAVSGSDTVYLIHGGVARRATVAQLMAAAGVSDAVSGPATVEQGVSPTTEGNIPQWDSTARKLKNGLELVDTINAAGGTGAPTDTQVPTAAAVRTAIDAAGQSTNFVKRTGEDTVAGVKTFTSSPLVPNVASTSDETQKAASTKWVADKLTAWWTAIKDAAQTISGAWTFTASPAVPTPMTSGTSSDVDTSDDTTKAANTAWVTAKIAAWWDTVKANVESISGAWAFSASPTVPEPTADSQVATKKYVDDHSAATGAVLTTGDQSVAGVKTFTSSPIVPETPTNNGDAASKKYVDNHVPTGMVATTGDQEIGGTKAFASSPTVPTASANDDSQKAASTAFVQAVVAASVQGASLPRFPIVVKTVSSNAVTFDDCSINIMSVAVGDTITATMPTGTNGYSRSFILVLTVTGTTTGTVTVNLSGGTFNAESADTFTITPGQTHVIGFTESGVETNHFLVSRRTFTQTGTAFTGSI